MLFESQDSRDDAISDAKRALESGDANLLATSLTQLSELDPSESDAEVQFTRGRCLSALGRHDDAVDAFERTLFLEPLNAAAHYSVGLELADRGRVLEAVPHWRAVLVAAPTHEDARYNLGQAYYALGDYDQALEQWGALVDRNPNDINALRKVVQAYRAAQRDDEADSWMARLRETWQTRQAGPDGDTKPEFVVVDQFRVNNTRVLAQELLSTPASDLATLLAFVVYAADDAPMFAVQLESSDYGRESGAPFMVGVVRTGSHQTTGPAFDERPAYTELKRIAIPIIERELAQAPRVAR